MCPIVNAPIVTEHWMVVAWLDVSKHCTCELQDRHTATEQLSSPVMVGGGAPPGHGVQPTATNTNTGDLLTPRVFSQLFVALLAR